MVADGDEVGRMVAVPLNAGVFADVDWDVRVLRGRGGVARVLREPLRQWARPRGGRRVARPLRRPVHAKRARNVGGRLRRWVVYRNRIHPASA